MGILNIIMLTWRTGIFRVMSLLCQCKARDLLLDQYTIGTVKEVHINLQTPEFSVT